MMKKARSSPDGSSRRQPSSFWTPKKAGEQIEGLFSHVTMSMQTKKPILHLSDVPSPIGVGTVLHGIFKEHASKLKAGVKLTIVYTGESAKKTKGNRAKLFDVFLNGKQIFNSEIGAPVPVEEAFK